MAHVEKATEVHKVHFYQLSAGKPYSKKIDWVMTLQRIRCHAINYFDDALPVLDISKISLEIPIL